MFFAFKNIRCGTTAVRIWSLNRRRFARQMLAIYRMVHEGATP